MVETALPRLVIMAQTTPYQGNLALLLGLGRIDFLDVSDLKHFSDGLNDLGRTVLHEQNAL